MFLLPLVDIFQGHVVNTGVHVKCSAGGSERDAAGALWCVRLSHTRSQYVPVHDYHNRIYSCPHLTQWLLFSPVSRLHPAVPVGPFR